jgi:hypothetical protein
VFLLFLTSVILSVSAATTNAAPSSLVKIPAPSPLSHPPSPTVTAKSSSSRSTTAAREAKAVPLTLVDIVGTLAVALIPALVGGLFIIARWHSRRKREQVEWLGQVPFTQEEERLYELGGKDFDTGELEEQLNRTEDDALQRLLGHAPVTGELGRSRLSRLKCRLRVLEEPVPSQ